GARRARAAAPPGAWSVTSAPRASGRSAPFTGSAAADGSRSRAATLAPRAASSRTVARPMPDPPPVTAATRPSNSRGTAGLLDRSGTGGKDRISGVPCPPSAGGSMQPGAKDMELRLQGVPIPVSHVDAAKAFYTERGGFHLDPDIRPSDGMRVVQLTPPGSACSVVLGEGLPLGEPGSVKGVQLVVEDVDAVREALAGRGVPVGDVQQLGPEGTPGSRYVFFEDPDGNLWAVQEYRRSTWLL